MRALQKAYQCIGSLLRLFLEYPVARVFYDHDRYIPGNTFHLGRERPSDLSPPIERTGIVNLVCDISAKSLEAAARKQNIAKPHASDLSVNKLLYRSCDQLSIQIRSSSWQTSSSIGGKTRIISERPHTARVTGESNARKGALLTRVSSERPISRDRTGRYQYLSRPCLNRNPGPVTALVTKRSFVTCRGNTGGGNANK
jgi:hypothetical protein